jgi:glycosyltransferase involved in cell wall biosynthesis
VSARRDGLRVAVATRLYPPEAAAASFRMKAVVDALAAGGAEVDVYTTVPPARASAPERRGVRVRRWPVLRDSSGAIRGFAQYLSFDIPLVLRLLFARADVFVAEAPPTTGVATLIAAALRRRTFYYYPGDVWTDGAASMGASRVVVGVLAWLERLAVRRARAVFAVSPEVGARLAEIGGDRCRVVEVGNGIDTEVFTPEGESVAAGPPTFVYAGTMSEWQRPVVFVEALALLDRTDVELRFFGQGSEADAVRAAGERLAAGRVHVAAPVPATEIAAWLRGAVGALVSIVPGIGYDFARPTKTYAAAAVGAPVLYAGAETGAQLVRAGGLGEAVAFDAWEIADAMGRMLEARDAPAAVAARQARVEWVRANASLRAAGERAAATVVNDGPVRTRR